MLGSSFDLGADPSRAQELMHWTNSFQRKQPADRRGIPTQPLVTLFASHSATTERPVRCALCHSRRPSSQLLHYSTPPLICCSSSSLTPPSQTPSDRLQVLFHMTSLPYFNHGVCFFSTPSSVYPALRESPSHRKLLNGWYGQSRA